MSDTTENVSPVEGPDKSDPVEEMATVMELADEFTIPSPITPADQRHPHVGAVRVQRMPHATDIPLPEYKSAMASGFDLIAANHEPIFLNSIGASVMIPTGICLEIPAGLEGQVRPRSGLAAKHGITVTNTPGTIDADYRGEIKVLLTNLTGRRFTVERGMRIAQFVICPVVQVSLEEVDSLGGTVRGTDGFGSTGV